MDIVRCVQETRIASLGVMDWWPEDMSETMRESVENDIYFYFPRRKDSPASPPRHVSVSRRALRRLFHLPPGVAAKEMGLCSTTFKKACRRFGIVQWPYRRGHLNLPCDEDDDEDFIEQADLAKRRSISPDSNRSVASHSSFMTQHFLPGHVLSEEAPQSMLQYQSVTMQSFLMQQNNMPFMLQVAMPSNAGHNFYAYQGVTQGYVSSPSFADSECSSASTVSDFRQDESPSAETVQSTIEQQQVHGCAGMQENMRSFPNLEQGKLCSGFALGCLEEGLQAQEQAVAFFGEEFFSDEIALAPTLCEVTTYP